MTPGYFCCCTTAKPDQSFRKFGLGICLYFKFLKHSMGVITIITTLALFVILACIWVSSQNGFEVGQNYNTFLFSTTLGVFASEHTKCTYSKIDNNDNLGNSLTFPYQVSTELACPYGRVNYFGAVYSN